MSDEPKANKELIDKITLLKDEDKNKEALEMVIEAQKTYPKDASLWFLKARALNGLNRPEESIGACDKAIEYCHDKPVVVHNYKGNILLEQENSEDALKEYEKSLSIDSNSVDALVNKAGLLIDIKGVDNAPVLPIADRIIQLDPKNGAGWAIRAAALHVRKENKEAEIAINRALEISPNYIFALLTKTAILQETGRQPEALKIIKQAEEIDPNNSIVKTAKEDLMKIGMEREYAKNPNMPTTPEEAKRTLMKCYACTIGVGGLYTMFALGGIYMNPAIVLTIPLIFFAAFSLYWGWGDVWPKWKNLFGGSGFASGNWILWIIVVVLFVEIPALIAVFYGAFVGIGRYKKVKAIADRKQ